MEIITVLENALQVSLKGMAGIFVFMFIFFLVIKGIDRMFPEKKKNSSQ